MRVPTAWCGPCVKRPGRRDLHTDRLRRLSLSLASATSAQASSEPHPAPRSRTCGRSPAPPPPSTANWAAPDACPRPARRCGQRCGQHTRWHPVAATARHPPLSQADRSPLLQRHFSLDTRHSRVASVRPSPVRRKRSVPTAVRRRKHGITGCSATSPNTPPAKASCTSVGSRTSSGPCRGLLHLRENEVPPRADRAEVCHRPPRPGRRMHRTADHESMRCPPARFARCWSSTWTWQDGDSPLRA